MSSIPVVAMLLVAVAVALVAPVLRRRWRPLWHARRSWCRTLDGPVPVRRKGKDEP